MSNNSWLKRIENEDRATDRRTKKKKKKILTKFNFEKKRQKERKKERKWIEDIRIRKWRNHWAKMAQFTTAAAFLR